MTKNYALIPVLLLAAALAAVVLPLMAKHAPNITIAAPAQASVSESLAWDNAMLSTNHANSLRVIQAFQALPQVSTTGGEFSEGSIQIWAGTNPHRPGMASVAIVWGNSNTVWYGALQGPLIDVGSPTAIAIGEKFLDLAALEWAGAWILSGNTKGAGRLVDDPSQYLDIGTGYARWLETKAKWGLNIPVMVIPTLLPPPPPGTPGL